MVDSEQPALHDASCVFFAYLQHFVEPVDEVSFEVGKVLKTNRKSDWMQCAHQDKVADRRLFE